MISSKKVLVFWGVFSFLIISFGYSMEMKIRIVKKGAELKLNPDINSPTLMTLPLGGELSVADILEGWYKIKLPSFENKEILVSGFINFSFVEVVKAEDIPTENRFIPPPITKTNLIDAFGAEDTINWNSRLSKAKNKQTIGIVSLALGVIIAIPSIYYSFYNTYGKTDIYGYPLTLSTGGWVAAILGDVLAIGGIITGTVLISSASHEANQLYEEARIKGYEIRAGLVLNKSSLGFKIGLAF
jgi:hypothetical protein